LVICKQLSELDEHMKAFITELLRNGASLVEARELARHSDIRMTMQYTHIGIDDQARAVAAISAPRSLHSQIKIPGECAGSKTCGKACHLLSSADNRVTMELATAHEKTAAVTGVFIFFVSPWHPMAPRTKSGGGHMDSQRV